MKKIQLIFFCCFLNLICAATLCNDKESTKQIKIFTKDLIRHSEEKMLKKYFPEIVDLEVKKKYTEILSEMKLYLKSKNKVSIEKNTDKVYEIKQDSHSFFILMDDSKEDCKILSILPLTKGGNFIVGWLTPEGELL